MDKIEKNINKIREKNKTPKKKSKHSAKSPKKKAEKQIIVTPRARLEPRLSLPSSKKIKKEPDTITDIEKDKRLIVSLNTDEIEKHLKHYNSNDENKSPLKNVNERNKECDSERPLFFTTANHEAALESIENFGDEEDFETFIKQSRQQLLSKGLYWTDREIRDLAYALQYHGFADLEVIAAEVKTKTKNDIKDFLKSRIQERSKKKRKIKPEKQRGRPKSAFNTTVSQEILATWPTVRKWRRLAYEQMYCAKNSDYSKPVISALCKTFYEEEPEPDDPQVINVKLIYKYISDCMAGAVPPQLPPKESALVLDILREARSFPIVHDFEEEIQFIKDFTKATTFKPFQVKDEFKKRFKDPEEVDDPKTVAIPESLFLELSRHRKLLQSFNPLMTPLWLIQKEQEYLEKYLQESEVLVE